MLIVNISELKEVESFLKAYTKPCRNKAISAYTLKHIIQYHTGVYMRECDMCDILRLCGYTAVKGYNTWFHVDIDRSIYKNYYLRKGGLYESKLCIG
jgi:hypothetical protein